VVAKLDSINSRLLYLAQVLLNDARKAGIAPDREEVRRALEQQRLTAGRA
jgi:hypothetical protein